jgi:hypothetical protein
LHYVFYSGTFFRNDEPAGKNKKTKGDGKFPEAFLIFVVLIPAKLSMAGLRMRNFPKRSSSHSYNPL